MANNAILKKEANQETKITIQIGRKTIEIGKIAKILVHNGNIIDIEMLGGNYKIKDLIEIYKNDPEIFKQFKKGNGKIQCFIILSFNNKKLIFIPINDSEKTIINFAYTNFDFYDKVKEQNFITAHNYINLSRTNDMPTTSLHEFIYGKKAEKGGWKLIKKNDTEIVEGKIVNKTKAFWITMLSGRSLDKNDPDPNCNDFYYYHNEENNYNIKVAGYNENSNWYVENETEKIGPPSPSKGNIGDFYKDSLGNIYTKVDKHVIDHFNNKTYDARIENLREISAGANNKNREKKEGAIVSKYIGVNKVKKSYVGFIRHNKISYTRSFESEIEAAKFHDYNLFARYGIEMSHNGTLNREEINNLLLNGVSAIPEEFSIIEKIKLTDFQNIFKIQVELKGNIGYREHLKEK